MLLKSMNNDNHTPILLDKKGGCGEAKNFSYKQHQELNETN